MIKRFFQLIFGTISIMLGLVGFLVPIMPGWFFIFFGVLLISPNHGKKMVTWLKNKINERIPRKKTPPTD